MKKTLAMAAIAAATALASTPVQAGSPDGKIQVKVLGTAVLPDGKIDKLKRDDLNLPTGSQTKANDNYVPTLAAEYFFNKSFSVETICCFTQHHVNGSGALEGTRIVNHVLILPATVTLKAHLDTGSPIKPYIGAGPTLFVIFGEKPGETARALGATSLKMSNELGVALQGGVDVALGDGGFGLSLDAKKYWVNTTLHVKAGEAEVLTTKHKLDPWVLSAGVSYRF
ncbi:OmpW/AlkL family protein [Novosphingobium aquimarinum]|uniref:OmpW/AlkL family protein n=1 Tax=Novosphingobium aquimarinum TaxID=2682494 RepID=UPI0012EC5DFA|nr:OmpW family outer membrane protein [Novosphingobium aquimarinum]